MMMAHMNMCIERDFIDVPFTRIMLGRLNAVKYSAVQRIQQFLYNVWKKMLKITILFCL